MYKLVISDDEGKTTVVPLVRDEITIGRKEGNTIRLTERNVSRRHARLARQNGHFVVHDLDSYNGVRINGQRIEQQTQLKAGDQVLIGDYILALQSAEQAAANAPGAQTSSAPPARLVMLTPPAPGAEFAIPEGAVRIGRAEDLDIWVNHRSISREHAEIRREGDQFTVADLESANGVRVNNEDCNEVVLTPGDEIELGQVRFRFVGEGERYSFEADRTIQMDALTFEEEPPSRRNLYIGLTIVAIAACIGAFVAIDGTETTSESPVVTPIVTDNTSESPESEADQLRRLMAETEACVEALQEQDFAAATAAAERALEIDPDNAMASDCRRRAVGRVGAQSQFEEGVAHLEGGRIEDAWLAFDSLPTDSPFRDRPEVEQARLAFGQHYLDRAIAHAEASETEEALRSLQQVYDVGDDEQDAELLEAAHNLEERLRAPAQATADRPRMRPRPRGDSFYELAEQRRRREAAEAAMMAAPMMDTPVMRPEPVTVAQVSRECNRNNLCIIRRLEAAPKTERTLAFLIETYRQTGNAARVRTLSRTYVNRFPSGREYQRLRRQLDAQN